MIDCSLDVARVVGNVQLNLLPNEILSLFFK